MEGYLRGVAPEDMDLLYEWANEKEVRKNAFHSEAIPYEAHKRWFTDMMSSDHIFQYIYMINDKPIGQIRFNVVEECAYIDYSICLDYRKNGYGKKMLALSEEIIKKEHHEIKQLIAQVKYENQSSRNVMESLKYQPDFVEYRKKIE